MGESLESQIAGKPAESGAPSGLPTYDHTEAERKLPTYELRQAILAWRDTQMERIDRHLRDRIKEVHAAIEFACRDMPVQHLLVQATQKAFSDANIFPIYSRWVEVESKDLIDSAQESLSKLFQTSLVSNVDASALNAAHSTQHVNDATRAGAAIGGGIVAIPIIGSMSMASVGGVLGFLGVTAISWPVVAIGAVVVGSLFAFGGKRATEIKTRAINSYVEKMIIAVDEQVIGAGMDSGSLSHRLQGLIYDVAKKTLKEIDQCKAI